MSDVTIKLPVAANPSVRDIADLEKAGWSVIPGHPDLYKRNGDVEHWRDALSASILPPPPKPGYMTTEFLVAGAAVLMLVPAVNIDAITDAASKGDWQEVLKAVAAGVTIAVVQWFKTQRQTAKGGGPS